MSGETEQQPDSKPDPAVVHVEMSWGTHQVVVEAAEPLAVVSAAALDLWKATDQPGRSAEAGPAAVGFAMSERTDSLLMPPEAELPYRLVN